MLLPKISDTAATSQDGSSLEFIAAIAGRQCYIQDASGRGLCGRGGDFYLIHWTLGAKKITFLHKRLFINKVILKGRICILQSS